MRIMTRYPEEITQWAEPSHCRSSPRSFEARTPAPTRWPTTSSSPTLPSTRTSGCQRLFPGPAIRLESTAE